MVDIPFPTTSAPGRRPGEGAGVLYNASVEKLGEGVVWRRMPGLDAFSSLPTQPIRGVLPVGRVNYVVAGSKAYVVDATGAYRALDGDVSGDGPVCLARNNAASPDVVMTTSGGNYILTSLAVQPYPSGSLPQCNSVAWLDSYFLFTTESGDCWASGPNVIDVNPVDFQKAEARPDGLLRGFVYQQQFYACGPSSIEVYQNNGATSGFPLARSTVIGVGIAGQWCAAGFDDGWDGEPIFVAADNTVRTLAGLNPTRISTADIEADIAAVADKSTLRACVFTFGGHAIWSLSSPSWTWQYDVSTTAWIKRESHQAKRWRCEFSARQYGGWLLTDATTGSVYRLNEFRMTEAGAPLIFGLDSGPVKQYPARIACPDAFFDFTLGHGVENGADPVETEPKVMISWDHEGGLWTRNPLEKSLGRQGHYVGPVRQNLLGVTTHHGVRFRWRISDPVPVSFAGGRMNAQERKP